jgi:DNA-binding IclR family transcriptional regulator
VLYAFAIDHKQRIELRIIDVLPNVESAVIENLPMVIVTNRGHHVILVRGAVVDDDEPKIVVCDTDFVQGNTFCNRVILSRDYRYFSSVIIVIERTTSISPWSGPNEKSSSPFVRIVRRPKHGAHGHFFCDRQSACPENLDFFDFTRGSARVTEKSMLEQRSVRQNSRIKRSLGRGQESEGGVAAVDRALTILLGFRTGDVSLTLAELAKRTSFHKSTILRLACSLERFGFLTRHFDGSWRLGGALTQLGALHVASHGLGDVVPPLLRQLVDVTGESASFHVRQDEHRICLYRVDSPHRIREHAHQGELLPLEVGAGGKVLMAFDGAKGDLYDRVRRDFVLALIGDRVPEVAGVSAPVFGSGQLLSGAITVSGPSTRFGKKELRRIENAVVNAAANLTRLIGGDATVFKSKCLKASTRGRPDLGQPRARHRSPQQVQQ